MNKRFFVGLLIFLMIPFGVNADVKTVNNQAELKDALGNAAVSEIVLGSDIETTDKIDITRDVTIDGNGHSISYVGQFFKNGAVSSDNTVWSEKSSDGTAGAVYVLQAYMCKVTLKDITLTGGNRGLGINGAEVTLESSIGFANNGFQDIELSHGTLVDSSIVSTLKLAKDVVIVTDGEDSNVVSWLVFVDDLDGAIVYSDGTTKTINKGTSMKSSELATDLIVLNSISENTKEVSADIFTNSKVNGTKLGFGYVDDNGDFLYTWEFLGSDIENPMTLNTKITFTEEAPSAILEDVSKVVVNYQNVSYLNFEHNGKLPGKATVSYDVSNKYSVGTKLYVAHFNEATRQLENAREVTVDVDGSISFDITECSSYVLYTGIDNTNTINTVVTNAKTGDMNLILMGVLVIGASIGAVVTSRKIVTKVK